MHCARANDLEFLQSVVDIEMWWCEGDACIGMVS